MCPGPSELMSLRDLVPFVVGVRNHLVHRVTVLLRVSTVVAFCAALIGGWAAGAKAEITTSVPAGVPLWGPGRFLATRSWV